MTRIVALAIVASLATISAPASAKPADSMPSGPAAQAILQWFTTDRSLGCSDQQGNDLACTVGVNWPEFEVYYGDSTGGGPQADALAFIDYGPYPGGNMVSLSVAYFHSDGGNYRFIKTFPNVLGDGPIKGTTVRFLPGKANFSMTVLQGDDLRCCPTGRASYTVTLNPTAPAPRVGGALAASPEADYLEARDKAIAEVKALENSKASQSAIDAAMDKALADLTKRLKDIVGPVSGFPGAGRLNLDTLSEHQVGYGNMDGVAYVDQDLEVVVTTRLLLTAWLEGKAKDEDKESRLPTDVEAAVRQENFYSGGDVAFAKYADLPVTKPAGAALAVAALGLFRQDNTASLPDTIVATIVEGGSGLRRQHPPHGADRQNPRLRGDLDGGVAQGGQAASRICGVRAEGQEAGRGRHSGAASRRQRRSRLLQRARPETELLRRPDQGGAEPRRSPRKLRLLNYPVPVLRTILHTRRGSLNSRRIRRRAEKRRKRLISRKRKA